MSLEPLTSTLSRKTGKGLTLLVLALLFPLLALTQGKALAQDVPTNVEKSDTNAFRFGFSSKILVGFNENDARAAAKTWIKSISKERNLLVSPTPQIYQDTATMAQQLKAKSIDALSITLDEYWSLQKQVHFTRMTTYTRHNEDYKEKYLLVTRKESNLQVMESLNGHSLLVLEAPTMSLAEVWLDTLLMEHKLGPARQYFSSMVRNTRLNKVVLPVFFRQCDACLITESGFQMLGELNPQVTNQMVILESSPDLIPSGTFFRNDRAPDDVQKAIEELCKIHTSPAGQQLLNVFQIGKIIEIPISNMGITLQLLARHDQLCEPPKKELKGPAESTFEMTIPGEGR